MVSWCLNRQLFHAFPDCNRICGADQAPQPSRIDVRFRLSHDSESLSMMPHAVLIIRWINASMCSLSHHNAPHERIAPTSSFQHAKRGLRGKCLAVRCGVLGWKALQVSDITRSMPA